MRDTDEPRRPLEVTLPRGGYARSDAVEAVRSTPLRQILAEFAPGPFGLTATCTAVLEALIDAADVGIATAAALEGLILAELTTPGSFEVAALKPAHRRLIAALQIVATCDDAVRRIQRDCPSPHVEGSLEVDGVDALFDVEDPAALARRICTIAGTYLRVRSSQHDPEIGSADVFAGTTIAAAFLLLRRTVEAFARGGAVRPMLETLSSRSIRIVGFPYDGLKVRRATETPSGLLPIQPGDIVGNDEYVDAGMRLARDVAGFDRTTGKNPKRINPVLFGLGSPGCGKTVTAHAIGNYFLEYCRNRDIPARFPRPWQMDASGWLSKRAEGGFTREVVSHFLFLTLRRLGALTLENSAVTFPEGDGSEQAIVATLVAGEVPVHLTGRVGGTEKADHNLWVLEGDAGTVRLRDWSFAERLDASGRWLEVEDAMPNELARPLVLRRQLDKVARLVRGAPQDLATVDEALQVQTVVEDILSSGNPR